MTENPYYEQLERLRDAYSQRRGLVPEMLYEAEKIMGAALEYKDAQCQGRVDEAHRETDRQTKWRLDAEERLREAQQQIRSDHELREYRTQDGVSAKVAFSLPGHWQVSHLEEIAYRLRCGGATDDSPVKIDNGQIRGWVPDASVVRLDLTKQSTQVQKTSPTLTELIAALYQVNGWDKVGMRPIWAVIAGIILGVGLGFGIGMELGQ